MKEVKIKITIQEEEVELSIEDAKALWSELNSLFEKEETKPLPSPFTIPYAPPAQPYTNHPGWGIDTPTMPYQPTQIWCRI
tara:strand:- start:10479 stop:10721 length:243 start_codon:yes stop_codon:yes gene_type:complete